MWLPFANIYRFYKIGKFETPQLDIESDIASKPQRPGLDCLVCGEQRFSPERKVTEELVEETFAANLRLDSKRNQLEDKGRAFHGLSPTWQKLE